MALEALLLAVLLPAAAAAAAASAAAHHWRRVTTAEERVLRRQVRIAPAENWSNIASSDRKSTAARVLFGSFKWQCSTVLTTNHFVPTVWPLFDLSTIHHGPSWMGGCGDSK